MTTFIRRLLPLLFLSTLLGCQTTQPETVEPAANPGNNSAASVETGKSSNQSKDKPSDKKKIPEEKFSGSTPVTAALSPGTYCYQMASETNDIATRLTVDAADRVTGKLQGSVHNKEAGYYTGYIQKLDGTIDGSNLNLDVATWIEYDKQNDQETWKVQPNQLVIDDASVLGKADCAEVSKAFQNKAGLEAKDLTASATNIKTEQVSFGTGKSGTTVSGAVVRGDRNIYLLNARGGQTMDLSITSLENNAVFDVVAPSGLILGTELTNKEIFLPHTGDYEVVVGGTRGNATYDLAIAIQ